MEHHNLTKRALAAADQAEWSGFTKTAEAFRGLAETVRNTSVGQSTPKAKAKQHSEESRRVRLLS